MKKRLFTFLPIISIMLTCAGCGSPGTVSNTEQKSSDIAKACPRTPSFNQTAATVSFLPPPSTVQTGIARPFDEIYAGLSQLKPNYNDSPYESERQKADTYLREQLEGKQVKGWEGWVVNTGVEAIRSMQMKWTLGSQAEDNPANTEPFRDTILITMQNPFANTPQPTATPDRMVLQIDAPLIALTDVSKAASQPVCIGQKVRFDGNIAEAPEIIFTRGDFIVLSTSISLVEMPTAASTMPEDLADLRIELRRIPGWFGPDYHLTLFGNGTLLFEGRSGVATEGFKIATVSEEVVRQVLAEFDKAGFATMSETEFAEYGVSDAPSARITLYYMGKRKSIYHYFGNDVPAEKLTQLEDKIDELLKTEQWVGKQ